MLLTLLACTPDDAEDSGAPHTGACGEVSEWELSLQVAVERDGQPAAGATVSLVDRGWSPGTVLGTATADAAGEAVLSPLTITSVEGCWGTLLDYVVTATDGTRSGEAPVNPALFNAIDDGSLSADVRDFPIQL